MPPLLFRVSAFYSGRTQNTPASGEGFLGNTELPMVNRCLALPPAIVSDPAGCHVTVSTALVGHRKWLGPFSLP